MTKHTVIIILGLITALTPFLGFPVLWEKYALIVFGLLISLLAFLTRGEAIRMKPRLRKPRMPAHDVFVENAHISTEDTSSRRN